jgi:ABC-type Fe2+-enterobactin transport system substrate-binding protein
MNVSVTWNPGDTWRKLGYLYYTNSLEFRAVIDQNPQWSVTEEPPVGTVLSLSVNNQRALGAANNPTFFVDTDDAYTQELIFPFGSTQEYEAQVAKYSLYSLLNYNELNGYTMDTTEAKTGNP